TAEQVASFLLLFNSSLCALMVEKMETSNPPAAASMLPENSSLSYSLPVLSCGGVYLPSKPGFTAASCASLVSNKSAAMAAKSAALVNVVISSDEKGASLLLASLYITVTGMAPN